MKNQKGYGHCFKCGGDLELIEDNDWMGEFGGIKDTSFLICTKCKQVNNWHEKEQWLKKKTK